MYRVTLDPSSFADYECVQESVMEDDAPASGSVFRVEPVEAAKSIDLLTPSTTTFTQFNECIANIQ